MYPPPFSSPPENRNVPNDGKFDLSQLSASFDTTVPVGRIDFGGVSQGFRDQQFLLEPTEANLRISESMLLRRYFDKDHNFRHALLPTEERALIDDHFGPGLRFAENGWNNFAPLVGKTNIFNKDWKSELMDTPTHPTEHTYLWAYGCGPGSEVKAGGVVRADDYVFGDPPVIGPIPKYTAVFNLLLGSKFGDFNQRDHEPDGPFTANLMRVALASEGRALTVAWAGLPFWYLHTMALDEPIGTALLMSQNNPDGGLYRPAAPFSLGTSSTRGTHVAVMGDPTLQMKVIAPPTVPWVEVSEVNVVHWSASPDPEVLGYYIYRADTLDGPFTRIGQEFAGDTFFVDGTAVPGNDYAYMVRAIKLESSPSGTYYNASQGVFADTRASGGFDGGDSASGGNWAATYGTEGAMLAGDSSTTLSVARVIDQVDELWSNSTSDQRALMRPGGTSTNRLAAAWTSTTSFVVELNFTDRRTHNVALYFLDWNRSGRRQMVTVYDPRSGRVVDRQQVSNFGEGKYLRWKLTGRVKIKITRTAGPSAVLSGIFVGRRTT